MRWFLLLIISASAVWAQPLVNMQTVVVSDVNNAPDSQGLGAVSYPYRIGKFEVTIGQYTTFLNSVATNASAAHLAALWHTNMTMARNPNIAGISRSGSGTPSDPYVYAAVGGSNRPIAFVSWFGAARFCNWLHNGATNGADTETGVYTLSGATSGSAPSKSTNALYWIPTQDEWMKAGFYKSGTTNAGYWMFPTQSDSAPGNLVGATPNQANYPTASGYSAPQGPWTSAANMLTDVGAFTASASAYGTFDQGGGLAEILDWGGTTLPTRGGTWDESLASAFSLRRTNQARWVSPSTISSTAGFRVAAKAAQPVITLLGANPMQIFRGTAFADPGATMINDSNVSSSISGTGTVNTSVLGSYSLVYAGSDSSGLPAQPVTRIVNVVLDPAADDDQDGLTNQLEQNLGSNPDLADSNADGIDDGRAHNLGYNPILNLLPIINSLKQAPVDGLYNQSQYNANRTNGQTDVTTNPAAFNLFTQSQFDGNRAAGRQDVIASPMAFGLYDSNSIMDLRMGGLMIQKVGTSATVFFQPQTTTNLTSVAFTDSGPPITKTFEMPGNKGFLRVQALAVAPDQMITVQGGTLPQSSQLAGTVVETFRIGKYEVTWGEWHRVKAWATSRGYDFDTWDVPDPDAYPVRRIGWNDAAKFCNAKSEMEQLQPVYQANGETYKAGWADPSVNQSANGYRLPSEAEWEWAARGGVSSANYIYSGSDNIDAVAWYNANHAGLGPRPGGQKAPNELGIYDMSGNLYEFTQDPIYGGSFRRSRGGSWFANPEHSRVVDRFDFPDYGFGHIGFRLARKVP